MTDFSFINLFAELWQPMSKLLCGKRAKSESCHFNLLFSTRLWLTQRCSSCLFVVVHWYVLSFEDYHHLSVRLENRRKTTKMSQIRRHKERKKEVEMEKDKRDRRCSVWVNLVWSARSSRPVLKDSSESAVHIWLGSLFHWITVRGKKENLEYPLSALICRYWCCRLFVPLCR